MDDVLPLPLMTSEQGSFARMTIVERKPQIIEQVIADNGYPPEIVRALEAFREEIAQRPLQPLTEPAADTAFWNGALGTYQGRTWLELPWYFAEAYFYRRLLEAVRYVQPGPWQGHDPFGAQKRTQERAAAAWLAESWDEIGGADPEVAFEVLLHSCLWGNRADLSNLTVQEKVRAGASARQERHRILIDHTRTAASRLSAGMGRVDVLTDNTGLELLFDLALAEFLLSQGWVHHMVFHLKDRPFFVSDAMPQDVQHILTLLRAEALGRRLDGHLTAGLLVLRDDPFWTSHLMFRQMPASLTAELAESNLVVLKGDVNYRRLLDDLHWPHTTRLEDITAYFPAPFLALRTLKAEIMVGLGPGQAEELSAQDPSWLINGRRGVIQYVRKAERM